MKGNKCLFIWVPVNIRQHLFADNLNLSDKEDGEFKLDESYFGAKRVRGKRGRGAAGKTPVFGLLKRDGKVYVEIVKNCTRDQLLPIIQGKILEGSTINTDGWKAYDSLVLNGYTHHGTVEPQAQSQIFLKKTKSQKFCQKFL